MAEFNRLVTQDGMSVEATAINSLLMNADFEIDSNYFETNQLTLLANICKVINPMSVSGSSSINASLAELENKKLLMCQQVVQIQDDIKCLDEKSIEASSLQEEIKVLVNQMETSKTRTEKEISLVDTTDLSELDRKLEKLDLQKSSKMKEEYEEYLTLKSQSAKYDQKISNIPINQDISLDKASLNQLLRTRKEYLNQLLQDVIIQSTTD